MTMSNASKCKFCESMIIWLPLRGGKKMELFDAESFPFEELSPGNRWAIVRHVGVIDIDDRRNPPPRGIRKHYCKGSYENRKYRLWTIDKPSVEW